MTNFSKILNQMGAMYSEERYRYIASFSNYSLLILDDLGIERSTEYALEQVYAVIDERYKSGLPVIITTNLKIAEIRNPQDVAYAGFTAGFWKCVRRCESVERTAERALEKKNSRSLRRYLIYEVQGKKGVFRR